MGFKKGRKKTGGRQKGTSNYVTQLKEALKKYEKIKKKSFSERFVEMAYDNEKVAIALANKLYPDLTKLQGDKDNPIPIITQGVSLDKFPKDKK